jgi:large subunit ribosomal protein L6
VQRLVARFEELKMSRIGKLPIPLVTGVQVKVDGARVFVEGPKGKLDHELPRGISATIEDQQLVVRSSDDSKGQKSLHGLARALLANAVHGVSQGFSKRLEIHGVGFSALLAGRDVNFKLGYSHPVVYPLPEGIEVKVERNVLTVSGYDRQRVGQVAAEIRALRPPDVYKLKGIRYAGERLRKKAGKAGAK